MNTDRILEFVTFVDNELDAAIDELEGIESGGNRKHLQRLVYANLVDRFDSMVDHTLLDNSMEATILDQALAKLNAPLSEGQVLELLSLNDIDSHIELRAQAYLRDTVLRKRHSQKLGVLFSLFDSGINTNTKPRVNINDGKIVRKFTPPDNRIPASICGYADWLYSRRNTVVHGAGGSNLLGNDVKQLKRLYKCNPATSVRISIGSINTASQFYYSASHLLMGD
jgi:hypothetical protein